MRKGADWHASCFSHSVPGKGDIVILKVEAASWPESPNVKPGFGGPTPDDLRQEAKMKLSCSSPRPCRKHDPAQLRWWAACPRRGRVGLTQRRPEIQEAPPETDERCSSASQVYLVPV